MARASRRGGVLLGLLIGGAVLAACSNSPGTPSAGSTTSTMAAGTTSTTSSAAGAACTHSALAAAATNDTSLGPVDAVVGFGCSGTWAYANVTVGSGSGSYDAVIVLQVQGSSWSVADRANVCSNHLVPSDIYTQACTTS